MVRLRYSLVKNTCSNLQNYVSMYNKCAISEKNEQKKTTCMYMYNVPYHSVNIFNPLPASQTDANSLDPDQTLQSVVPDLDPNCFTISKFLENKQHIMKFFGHAKS